ncbi:helix-turn-helix domain-containing protein [Actinoplanes sp. NPDC026670]|uniref:winged helix-turn-helix transcriptional regulator n=1 Tax=Actinoplanes sp. NPDC026670 TaxID=3154700 RepID=UPI0033F5968A
MPLGTDYVRQNCAIARSLEIVGERWTLLIIRDLFYGLRRYSDLRKHIGLPPAVLTDRLARLIEEDVVERVPGRGAREEYALTTKGAKLWPVLNGLSQWGNEHYVEPESRSRLTHAVCGAQLDEVGGCPQCGVTPAAADVEIQKPSFGTADPYAQALRTPHRLLEPLRL